MNRSAEWSEFTEYLLNAFNDLPLFINQSRIVRIRFNDSLVEVEWTRKWTAPLLGSVNRSAEWSELMRYLLNTFTSLPFFINQSRVASFQWFSTWSSVNPKVNSITKLSRAREKHIPDIRCKSRVCMSPDTLMLNSQPYPIPFVHNMHRKHKIRKFKIRKKRRFSRNRQTNTSNLFSPLREKSCPLGGKCTKIWKVKKKFKSYFHLE